MKTYVCSFWSLFPRLIAYQRDPFVFDGAVIGRTRDRILTFDDIVARDLVAVELYALEFMGRSGPAVSFELLQIIVLGRSR